MGNKSNVVFCFNKKTVHSAAKGRDFYFLALRDEEGYSNDQIVFKDLFDRVNPPCTLSYRLSCSGQRSHLEFDIVEE